jgi:hypothetical protein
MTRVAQQKSVFTVWSYGIRWHIRTPSTWYATLIISFVDDGFSQTLSFGGIVTGTICRTIIWVVEFWVTIRLQLPEFFHLLGYYMVYWFKLNNLGLPITPLFKGQAVKEVWHLKIRLIGSLNDVNTTLQAHKMHVHSCDGKCANSSFSSPNIHTDQKAHSWLMCSKRGHMINAWT